MKPRAGGIERIHTALFDTPMASFGASIVAVTKGVTHARFLKAHALGKGKVLFDVRVKSAMVFLQTQDIVSLACPDVFGDILLAMNGVGRDGAAP